MKHLLFDVPSNGLHVKSVRITGRTSEEVRGRSELCVRATSETIQSKFIA